VVEKLCARCSWVVAAFLCRQESKHASLAWQSICIECREPESLSADWLFSAHRQEARDLLFVFRRDLKGL
jgi:hypothetical protein